MTEFIEQFLAMLFKMETLVAFSIVAFVQKVISRYIQHPGDGFFIAATAAILSAPLALQKIRGVAPTGGTGDGSAFSAAEFVALGVHKASCLLIVDTVMGDLVAPETDPEGAFTFAFVVYWLVSTALLVVVPSVVSLAFAGDQSPLTARIISFVYYMYAENGRLIANSGGLQHVLPFAALLGIILLWQFSRPGPGGHAIGTVTSSIIRGLTMALTNIIITVTMQTESNSSTGLVQVVWLLCILVMFDNMHESVGISSEIRDYALWKSSQRLQATLATMGSGTLFLLCVVFSLYMHAFHSMAGVRINVLSHAAILTAVNAILDIIKDGIANTAHIITWITLLCTISLVEVLLETVSRSAAEKV